MATPKKVFDFAKPEYVRTDIVKTDSNGINSDNDNRRNEHPHLLLSTTYSLNSSHTKKIHVGMQAANEDCFVPIVKLSGNYADGICLDIDTWQQFQGSMEDMRQYLCENQKTRPSPIIINNISISFTSAYGARAILVTYKEKNAEHSAENDETHNREEPTQPPLKKRKTYSVAVVMQKATFLGMENIVKCVDAQLAQLISIVDHVNVCVKYFITEIELKLPTSYVDCEIIKLTVKGNYQEIKRNVQTQINNLTFLDANFDIVFEELLSLRINEIARIILLKRQS
jgi:hypothetical protein